jgi:hypothetical protein
MKRFVLAIVLVLALVAPGWATNYYMRGDGTAVFKAVSALANNGSGIIQVTTLTDHAFANGQLISMGGFATQTPCNGSFTVIYPSTGPSPSTKKFDINVAYAATDTGKAVAAGPVTDADKCFNITNHNAGATVFTDGDNIYLSDKGGYYNDTYLAPNCSGAAAFINYLAVPGEYPKITPFVSLTSGWSKEQDGPEIWKCAMPGNPAAMNLVMFGEIQGAKQTALANIAIKYDHYYNTATHVLYVRSDGDPTAGYYSGTIRALKNYAAASLYVNNKNYNRFHGITFEGIEASGLSFQGSSANCQVDYCYIDGVVINGASGYGLNVGASTSALKFYNNVIMRCAYGASLNGATNAHHLITNNIFLGNRVYGVNALGNANTMTYSKNIFLGNGIGAASGSLADWTGTGGTDGGDNYMYTASAPYRTLPPVPIALWKKHLPIMTFTLDDSGWNANNVWITDHLMPIMNNRGLKFSTALVAGNCPDADVTDHLLPWIAAGNNLVSHGWSHQYYTDVNLFQVYYTGAAAASSLVVSGTTFSITNTGGVDNFGPVDLVTDYLKLSSLTAALTATGKYTVTVNGLTTPNVHSKCIADQTRDLKVATPGPNITLDRTRLTADEMASTLAWFAAKGLTTPTFWVAPGNIQDATDDAFILSNGFVAGRGVTAMSVGYNQVSQFGVNVTNMISTQIAAWHSYTSDQMKAFLMNYAVMSGLWGFPRFIYFHKTDNWTDAEMTTLFDAIQDLVNQGIIVWKTHAEVATYYRGLTARSGNTWINPGATTSLNVQGVGLAINAGADLGITIDLNSQYVPQGGATDIGAYEYNSSAAWFGF